jgi:hypothetical protein
MRVEVNDKMQKGYVYFRTKEMGRAFRPGFTPELTPKQMLALARRSPPRSAVEEAL